VRDLRDELAPAWARDGKELFFRNADQMLVVDVRTQPSFNATRPRLLFATSFARRPDFTDYDVSSDGQTFAMVSAVTRTGRRHR
jgi:hypothetical protein